MMRLVNPVLSVTDTVILAPTPLVVRVVIFNKPEN